MLQRKASADKLLLLGCDGMDPRLTRKFVDMGLMPNTKKLLERGSARHDLVMLGGHPTVTPSMWTTLACGCYSNVHGVTGYYRHGDDDDEIGYNFDSRKNPAEPLWDIFADAGKKTLVWHWPGSAWPPTSDNPNLMVVDGSSPGSVGMSVAQIEFEFLVAANEQFPEVVFKDKVPVDANALCVVTDLTLDDPDAKASKTDTDLESISELDPTKPRKAIIWQPSQMTTNITEAGYDVVNSPIKPASGWATAPEGAKEFTILLSKGMLRRPALIVKNAEGVYDHVEIYRDKKQTEPLAVLYPGKIVSGIVDEAYKKGTHYPHVNRNMKLLRLDPEGKTLLMHVSGSMDMDCDVFWHPKSLKDEICSNVGYPPPTSQMGRQDPIMITECMLDNWNVTAKWQADAINYLIDHDGVEVVFSHYHAIDLQGHMFIKHLADLPTNRQPMEEVEKWVKDEYIQCDNYLGEFMKRLDEGWTILVFSDHALISPKYGDPPLTWDAAGMTTFAMEALGYTVMQRDADGNRTGQVDWTKTRAVMQREGHVYINLKGREKHTLPDGTVLDGIVDPADKYELEEQIMTDLYGLRDERSGHRIVAVALRNRDAVLLGMGGPQCGDICCWKAEGYGFDHCDNLSTALGEGDTATGPIFFAAGPGIKEGFETDRIIREVDFAPTVAVLGGVRMPAQCEGAPAYQILTEEY